MRSTAHTEVFSKVRELVEFLNEYNIKKEDIVNIHYGDETITLIFYGGE